MTSASDRAREWLSLTQMGWEDSDDLETLTVVIGKAQADALRAAADAAESTAQGVTVYALPNGGTKEEVLMCVEGNIIVGRAYAEWLRSRAAEIENSDAQLPK